MIFELAFALLVLIFLALLGWEFWQLFDAAMVAGNRAADTDRQSSPQALGGKRSENRPPARISLPLPVTNGGDNERPATERPAIR